MSDKPYFVFTDELDLLFYNGYALVSDTEDELRFIQKILKSDVFWYYIKHTSKPYGGDYFALAKNYVKNFGVYNFSNDQNFTLPPSNLTSHTTKYYNNSNYYNTGYYK